MRSRAELGASRARLVLAFGATVPFLLWASVGGSAEDANAPRPLPLESRLAIIARAAPDVRPALPLRLDSRYSNPCWREANGSARHLRCMPAFFVAGALQSGVPDFWRRLRVHGLIGSRHDALSHWWTNHPRSRAGTFDTYVSRFSTASAIEGVEREPRTLLGDASPATFTYIMAESLRLHYMYLDAFDACYRRCRDGRRAGGGGPAVPEACRGPGYHYDHCYAEASRATVPSDFNVPALAATVLPNLRVIVLLREPARRLWCAYWAYGQYPAKYGAAAAGFGYYFGNQSAAFAGCAAEHGTHACALRFESHGAAQAGLYYHADQLIKGMYAEFLPEWQTYVPTKRLLVVRTDEYFDRPIRAVRRAWQWLGLRPPSADENDGARALKADDELVRASAAHGAPQDYPALLRPVRAFYAPFNARLAGMLRDPGFTRGQWAPPRTRHSGV